MHEGMLSPSRALRRLAPALAAAAVVAPGASELILPIALAVTKGLTVTGLAQTFAI